MKSRAIARPAILAAALLVLAGAVQAETIKLVCTFASTDRAAAGAPVEKAMTVDLDRKTVDGRPARITQLEIAFDVPGANPGDVTTTTISRFSGQMSVTSNVAGQLFAGRCVKAAAK